MNSRLRVMLALNHQQSDRLPKDLGGMRSTGISAFAYPRLVKELKLPVRRTRVEDTYQMLAFPDLDVLDALGIDVVTICDGVTNAFEQPDLWRNYDFNGRLKARVRNPANFRDLPDGTIQQFDHNMPPSSYVFDVPHGGQPLYLTGDLPKLDLKQYREEMASRILNDAKIQSLRDLCLQARRASDRAIFFNDASIQSPMGIGGYSGIGIFPILCVTEPDYVYELHQIATEYNLQNIRLLLPEIRDNIDIIMMAADDWGTQKNLIASPKVYERLFLPFYRQLCDECHRIAPQVKLYLHCCGAVYDLIDLVVESGFDILNPVQWPAGGHSFREWKEKSQGRIALWGGGVDSQHTLPLGSVEDVREQASEVARCLSQGGGYVFCNIHNLLAEVTPEKIIAMYRAAEQ